MSVARSFLLLSAGVVGGGLAMMTLEADIDWLRYVRTPRIVSTTPPAPAQAMQPAPMPQPAPATQTARSAPPVPVTVIVNQTSNQPSAGTSIGVGPWQGTGRQASLAKELQTELRRVGCYGGPIDGIWTPLSQRSMRAFVEGANANLPVGEPDHALLALARAAQGAVCAKPCPTETRPGADTVCKAARPTPETTAALVRSTPTDAPAQPPAPTPEAVAASTPTAAAALPRPSPRRPAQQAPSRGFGADVVRWLNKSLY
jgi:hypothetical protein